MFMLPVRRGNQELPKETLKEDRKNCRKIGPCGFGEKAMYLNNFFLDRYYYVVYDDVRRVFKRVAMSKGGFTGKGLFGSMPYLVVRFSDGSEMSCNFKYEDEVDEALRLIGRKHPEIPLHSEAAEKRLAEAKVKEEARYLKKLSPEAEASVKELRGMQDFLNEEPEIADELSRTAVQKRVIERMNPWYRYAAIAIFILAAAAAVFGIYSVFQRQGYAVYFLLFGFAFMFAIISTRVIPTGRKNAGSAEKEWQDALAASAKRIGEREGFFLPKQYAHPAVIERMIRVIREGRAVSVEEAYRVMKDDLKALNSTVTVSQLEYDEVVAVKPMFLLCGYADEI